MPIDYPQILERRETREYSWSERDAIFYALAVGMARDPLNERELRYAYERDLLVLPSFATVIAPRAGATLLAGLDYPRCVDAERRIELKRPIPPSGVALATTRVADVIDKGQGKGALVIRETILADEDAQPFATILTTTFARGDGGYGGRADPMADPPFEPEVEPDAIVDLDTWPNQALFYRLCGDRNPLHADPEAARRAGFERPVLHGMCTFGLGCRAIMAAVPELSAPAIRSLGARFVKPAFPGETVRFRVWRRGNHIDFNARVEARNVTVITHGRAELAPGATRSNRATPFDD